MLSPKTPARGWSFGAASPQDTARGEAEAAGLWVALGPLSSACLRGRGARGAPCATRPAQSRGWLGPRPLLRLEEGAASACQQLHFLETKKTEGRES